MRRDEAERKGEGGVGVGGGRVGGCNATLT